ncbi:hypothetical protein DPMN_067858 [Dreissena polymorpha]|uniref:Uncharacterized protein n=2 Tax=Dreissena polymorpha TaxID=45954 RepID=A0A9D4BW54_DREPO|nr:hypothetical protein DPMN_067858 [Dreissena polymorpha]
MSTSMIFIGLLIFEACSDASPTPIGESQTCFRCQNSALGEACNHTQTCSPDQGACISQISFTEDDLWVTRACAIRTICENSEKNNADECYWEDPVSYGFEGKCSFCCSLNDCNADLPANFRLLLDKSEDLSDTDVIRRLRAAPKPGGTTRPKPGGTTRPKPGGPKPDETTRPPTKTPPSSPKFTNQSATNQPSTYPPATNPPPTNQAQTNQPNTKTRVNNSLLTSPSNPTATKLPHKPTSDGVATHGDSGDRSSSESSKEGGRGDHSHNGKGCKCKGTQSIDVDVKIHIGRNQLNDGKSSSVGKSEHTDHGKHPNRPSNKTPTSQPHAHHSASTVKLSTAQPSTQQAATQPPSTTRQPNTQPTSTNPSATQTSSTNASTQQTTTLQVTTQSTIQQPTKQASTTQPSITQPETTQQSTSQPTTKPSTTQPPTTKPTTTQPSTTKPTTTQPTTTQPTPTQQPPTKQSTTQPSTSQSATTQQPTNQPPTIKPPATQQQTNKQPTTQPPTSQPPTTQPPSTQTPTTQQPTTQSPRTQPTKQSRASTLRPTAITLSTSTTSVKPISSTGKINTTPTLLATPQATRVAPTTEPPPFKLGSLTTHCHQCSGPIQICEQIHFSKPCLAPNNYCINRITNHLDGTKTVNRTCGNFDTCYRDWYLGTSDEDKCDVIKNNQHVDFQCTFCCIHDDCNVPLRPDDNNLYKPRMTG